MDRLRGLVAVASWEPRFVAGMNRILEEQQPSRVLMFFYREFSELTVSSRRTMKRQAQLRGCELTEVELAFGQPDETWRTLGRELKKLGDQTADVMVDITTMPRETIWATFFWLEEAGIRIRYAYHHPKSYVNAWLARDPDEPRIGFKLGGMPVLGRPTALLVVTGFDVDRVSQAVDFVQPARTLLVTQVGTQFDNVARNVDVHRGLAGGEGVEMHTIDVFASGHGYRKLKKLTRGLADEYNILLFSFGPKTSAVPLYRVQRDIPESGLAFIHCKEYNERYSRGIGVTIKGVLPKRPPR